MVVLIATALSQTVRRKHGPLSEVTPVNMWLFDPDGNVVEEGWRLSELRQLSGLDDAGLIEYLCRNMGYAGITAQPRETTICFNPQIVPAPTLAALLYWLADADANSFKIRSLGPKPAQQHAVADARSALQFVIHLVESCGKSGSERFYRTRLPVDATTLNDQFRNLLSVLHRFATPERSEFFKAYLRQNFAGRFVILSSDPEAGRLLLADAGNGYTGLASKWLRESIGKPIDQLPDRNYWLFVAEAFEATARAGTPTLDDIDAIVRTGAGTSSALSYRRMIVPLRNGTLLGVTVRNRDPIPLSG